MKVWELIEQLKTMPQQRTVVVDGFESYGYIKIAGGKEIDVQAYNKPPLYAEFEDFDEKKTNDPPIKVVYIT